MIVPEPPSLNPLEHISPASYEASLACLAKTAWFAFGDRTILPDQPAAMLGTCFHAVAAAAHRGGLPAEGEALRASARQVFDDQAQLLYRSAHPLLKCKFSSVERFPYYYIQRERAVVRAEEIAGARTTARPTIPAPSGAQPRTESRLASRDGIIVGRPDYLDRASEAVIDYKTGGVSEPERPVVSHAEARQLRLYAYLAAENGASVKTGEIIRGGGQRCALPISPAEAEAEADRARGRLKAFNEGVQAGRTFEELASPSAASCAKCPCIPFCEAFWKNASPEWVEECGVHIEGRVTEFADASSGHFNLVTLALNVRRGTLRAGAVAVEQIPAAWLAIGRGSLPGAGELVRVIHGRLAGEGTDPVVVRVDKTLTSVWAVPLPPCEQPGGPADG